jgi:hypothetical protein
MTRRTKVALATLPILLLALAGLPGCNDLLGLGDTGNSDAGAVAIGVDLDIVPQFCQMRLSSSVAPTANFQRVRFSPTASGEDVEFNASDSEGGVFSLNGVSLVFAPNPCVDYPTDAGTVGTIEFQAPTGGITFASAAGETVNVRGFMTWIYNVNDDGDPALPSEITRLQLPAAGQDASKTQIKMEGLPAATVVRVQISYEGDDNGTVTLQGTAGTGGGISLITAETVAIDRITNINFQFTAP